MKGRGGGSLQIDDNLERGPFVIGSFLYAPFAHPFTSRFKSTVIRRAGRRRRGGVPLHVSPAASSLRRATRATLRLFDPVPSPPLATDPSLVESGGLGIDGGGEPSRVPRSEGGRGRGYGHAAM